MRAVRDHFKRIFPQQSQSNRQLARSCDHRAPSKYLNPTTPTIINPRHTNRLTSRGSFKYIIPISTIPVVPSPVQTAYTVPTASFRLASAINPKLASITTKVPTITGQFFPQFLNPFENLNPKGQHISHAAANKRKIQAMRST